MAGKPIDVEFTFDARSVGKMRCEVQVDMTTPFGESVMVATDEGPEIGGDGTAPSPLALFTGALAGCMMTQLRTFAKRLRIPLDGARITGRTKWVSYVAPREPYDTEPVGFWLDIELDSEASVDDQRRLIAAAKRGCFIEQTLLRPNTIDHRFKIDGTWEEI